MRPPQSSTCGVESVRGAAVRSRRRARVVEHLDRRRVEAKRRGADELVELRRRRRAGDRRGDRRAGRSATPAPPGRAWRRRVSATASSAPSTREPVGVQVLLGRRAARALAEVGGAAVLAGQEASAPARRSGMTPSPCSTQSGLERVLVGRRARRGCRAAAAIRSAAGRGARAHGQRFGQPRRRRSSRRRSPAPCLRWIRSAKAPSVSSSGVAGVVLVRLVEIDDVGLAAASATPRRRGGCRPSTGPCRRRPSACRPWSRARPGCACRSARSHLPMIVSDSPPAWPGDPARIHVGRVDEVQPASTHMSSRRKDIARRRSSRRRCRRGRWARRRGRIGRAGEAGVRPSRHCRSGAVGRPARPEGAA